MMLDKKLKEELTDLVVRSLAEDIGDGDLTTEIVVSEPRYAKATIRSKDDGILAGIEIAEMVFLQVDDLLKVEKLKEDGEKIKEGDLLMKIAGNGGSLLKAERVALNFLGRMSGIASYTNQFVELVEGRSVILDTRKTTPTLRSIEKYAVRTGGGSNHRMGLYDQILIKENHAEWAGGLQKALSNALAAVGTDRDLIQLIVEARNKEEVKIASVRGVDRILLDNMTPEEVKKIREELPGRWKLEVSGGINLENVRSYADAGADYISIGALTHSVKAFDLTMLIDAS
ncbi:carboxylating nicotinate-nucleotide diphosphorylase [Candidatus Marinimicrobia bacterium MT.SAG.3]|nr:carboxylating nicotinate-nucleotide diphosphorylase [Candidatus Marinimicrobia bacterium MT.SAG.3]